MADRSIKYNLGILEDVPVRVGKFYIPVDFVVLDMEVDSQIPNILGRPFLCIVGVVIHMKNGTLTLSVGDDKITFTLTSALKSPLLENMCCWIDVINEIVHDDPPQVLLNDALEAVFMLEASEGKVKKLELKPFPSNLKYVFLDNNQSCPVIVRSNLDDDQISKFLTVLWFFQFPIHPDDQENTIFTCPYGTFPYRRVPFGLCNTPTTFQHGVTTIFSDFIESIMEVFMDDFSVYGSDFDVNLVLNREKWHFMVGERVVLGHLIFERGIQVDKAKIEVIEKLSPPVNVKGVRSFLGHAGIKNALATAPIIQPPDWNLLFKIICDASYYVVGAILVHFGFREYKSKWVEVIGSPTNDFKVVMKFFKNITFPRFEVPRTVINDGGSHFRHRQFETLLKKYGVTYKVGLTYHPHTSGQTSIGTTPYRIIYGKACHLRVELEHRAFWDIKELNMDMMAAGQTRLLQLNELDEFHFDAYDNSRIYKKRKKMH
ncbi:uncharacterized protein LOC141660888 [Apium graveolens]|uniref:uncharacterized protein LOC141660888 n=1 Tax=Apium graveolens TaxID=4045 RepID=UPI003D79F0AB